MYASDDNGRGDERRQHSLVLALVMSPSSRRAPRKTAQPGGVTSQQLLAAVPDMMFRVSRDGVYLDYKPARGLHPYRPPDEFLGKTLTEVLPSELAEAFMRLIEETLTTKEPTTYSYQLQVGDAVHTYEARIVGLGEDDVLAIVRDLTARAQHYGLTPREVVVLRLVAAGITDKEIGQRLDISALTARKHVATIRKKMNAESRTEAAVTALREGLVR